MILDARKGDVDYFVYDVKRMVRPQNVLWVNDQTAQWAQTITPYVFLQGQLASTVHQEEKITIHLAKKIVLFNEVDDQDPADADKKENDEKTKPPAVPIQTRPTWKTT